jgi:hypothetical protein
VCADATTKIITIHKMYYALIVIALFIILIICLSWLIINNNNNNGPEEISGVSDYFTGDCHLQRLLMIETLRQNASQNNNVNKSSSTIPSIIPGGNSHIASEIITAGHIKREITNFGKALSQHFNNNVGQVITALLHKRHNILQEYYKTMYAMICNDNSCTLPSDDDSQPVRAVFPDPLSHDSSDITTLVQRRLNEIAREITDTLAAAVNIHHKSIIPNNKEEFHHQRLYDLLIIYDRGLINQAKSYAAHDYDISMNSSQSSVGVARHIDNELLAIIKAQRKV